MSTRRTISRRQFVTGTSTLLMAGAVANAQQGTTSQSASSLAVNGGPKTITDPAPALVRWGDPEREQLDAMLRQRSLFYWKGPQTALMTRRFQKICPMDYVQTCSSGTAALHIAVAAAGIGPGDEVITSPITDMGTLIGILYQQAVPVFADLQPGTYNLDPADVQRKITQRTKAILPVHLAGNPCDLKSLKAVADEHELILIEDCAQAWGARYRGQPIGTVGHFACFSLQNSKQVTCGDGGVVGSCHKRFGPLLQQYGDKGYDRVNRRGGLETFATNYRISEPQAAVAAAQLAKVEPIAEKRSQLGRVFTEAIADIPGVTPHEIHPDDRCVYYFYMFRLSPEAFRCDRAAFVRALVYEGVRAQGGYIPVVLYREPVFQQHGFFAGRWPVKEMGLTEMDYTQVRCPEAEAILETGVRIILNEAMPEDYVRAMGRAVAKVASHYAV